MEEDWRYAQVKMDSEDSCSYTWSIDDLIDCCRNMIKMSKNSPMFSADPNKSEWKMQVNLNKDYNMSLSLFLRCCEDEAVTAKYKLSIRNANGEEISNHDELHAHKFEEGGCITIKNFLKRDECLQYADTGRFPDNKLIIYCQISVIEDIMVFPQQSALHVPEQSTLLDNLGLLFDDQKFSDVTIAVRGKEFQVHKVILAAQSPVLSAMFEHEMKERETNRVDITDMDPEVWREMVRFIYTGKVANLKEMANDLFSAADKYGVESLKKKCEVALVEKLNFKNATEIFILADLHDAPRLKAYVIDFIVTYATDVMDTEGFESMASSYPHLTKEILQALVTPVQTTSKICKEINEAQDTINRLRRSRYKAGFIAMRAKCPYYPGRTKKSK
ncbi:PREDICTED: speckle-type POZ protein A-like [Vollenhovia emeryi]|uniref:speckle-type POZ protein A-like n=1 Tax=Vollenhovia emeryi TaxID=411798 RepID=UPI0005F3AF26|nr:PREDICTED: speckle-type POZ protein A-like [Vollenhovia emeryi]